MAPFQQKTGQELDQLIKSKELMQISIILSSNARSKKEICYNIKNLFSLVS